MTTPTTPAECRAEQARWQKRIDAYDAALAKVCRLSDERTARHDAMVQAAGKKGEYCPPIPDPTPEHWDASEAWADAQKDLPDPILARAHIALLGAYAEALEREGWVPVGERLPEEGDRVLAYVAELTETGFFHYQQVSSLCAGAWQWLEGGATPKYWHPLPTPPAQAPAGGEG